VLSLTLGGRPGKIRVSGAGTMVVAMERTSIIL
jgi:hypothetical protein